MTNKKSEELLREAFQKLSPEKQVDFLYHLLPPLSEFEEWEVRIKTAQMMIDLSREATKKIEAEGGEVDYDKVRKTEKEIMESV